MDNDLRLYLTELCKGDNADMCKLDAYAQELFWKGVRI